MRGAWGDELIIKRSMRALASIAFVALLSGNDSGEQI